MNTEKVIDALKNAGFEYNPPASTHTGYYLLKDDKNCISFYPKCGRVFMNGDLQFFGDFARLQALVFSVFGKELKFIQRPKFSEYIESQNDSLNRAGEGYENLSEKSKVVIDYAIEQYIKKYVL